MTKWAIYGSRDFLKGWNKVCDGQKKFSFFLKEKSAKVFLEGLLPRILPGEFSFKCIAFEGKSDLERQLYNKIIGWKTPHTCFVVIRDKDAEDCLVVKKRLTQICTKARRADSLVRIACHELESWYLGDLEAVGSCFGINNLSKKQYHKKFRDPDRLANPREELLKLTQNKYQKVGSSRKLAQHIDPNQNTSASFNALVNGIQGLISDKSRCRYP